VDSFVGQVEVVKDEAKVKTTARLPPKRKTEIVNRSGLLHIFRYWSVTQLSKQITKPIRFEKRKHYS